MGVKFEGVNCLLSLALCIMKALKKMQAEFMERARAGMLLPEAKDELTEGELEVLAGAIAISIIGGAWVAMDEYGTGSLLDTSNPALAEYVRSDLFNPLRRVTMMSIGYAKVGRGKGRYRNIFGRTVESSGKLAGVNLEKLAEKGKLPRSFLPTPPSKALETAARWIEKEGRLERVLQEVLEDFPWGDFLVATKDRF